MKKFLISVSILTIAIMSLFSLGIVPSGATGEGPEGFFYNPASLGFNGYNTFSFDVNYTDSQNYTTSLFLGNNLGLVYTANDDSPSYKLLFGMGYPVVENLYLGYAISMDYLDGSWEDPVYSLGILGVPLEGVALGIYQQDITGGVKSTLNFGIGLRPLYLLSPSLGTKLTLFADMGFPFDFFDIENELSMASNGFLNNFNDLSYSFGMKIEPVDGLSMGAKISNFDVVEAGIGISGGTTDLYFSFNSDFTFSDFKFNVGMRLNEKPHKSVLVFPVHDYIVKFSHPFDSSSVDRYSVYNIDSFVSRIYQLADNPDCKTLYVVFDHPVVSSVGNLEEIKNAYFYFTGKGKRIVTYINNSFSQLDYLAAACGSKVIIPPTGFIFLSGVGGEFLFFKKLFEKEGIEVEYSRSSNYKSALDTFIREKLSKENREQYSAYLEVIYRLFKEILKNRGFDDGGAVKIIDNGPYDARTAKKLGLVDSLMYYDDFEDKYIRKTFPSRVKIVEYARRNWKEKPVIAVLKLSGPVVNSAALSPLNYLFGNSYITEKNTIPFIRMAGEDNRIKALVIQIDSPGGDGVISDEIWNALVKLKRKKPVVVVMGSVAASGGYYIAMAGDYIIAEKTTLTGSIGAFSYKYVVRKFLEKHGITTDSINFGKNYTLFSPFSELTKEQKEKMKEMTDYFVKQFYAKVAKSRGLSLKRVEEIGGGRIYSGEKALKLKLIDKIGDLKDAISYLREKLKIRKGMYRVEYYPDKKALMRMFIEQMESSDIKASNFFDNVMMKVLFLKPF